MTLESRRFAHDFARLCEYAASMACSIIDEGPTPQRSTATAACEPCVHKEHVDQASHLAARRRRRDAVATNEAAIAVPAMHFLRGQRLRLICNKQFIVLTGDLP